MKSDWSDDLYAALEEQLKLIRQFKLPGEEEDTVHECRCGGRNSRVMHQSELSKSAQHTEETRKIHHKNTSTESVTEDDVDAGLEQRLRLIRQSDRSEKEQSSNEVEEEMSHVCRCGSINSRVMSHLEMNEICPGPRPSFRPGPNEAHSEEFSPSVGGPRSSRAHWNRWS